MPGSYTLPEDQIVEFDPSTIDFVDRCFSKERKYLHFDLPLDETARQIEIDFSSEASPHRFLPLLGFTDEVRKFQRDKNGITVQTKKQRPIRFASHADAAYLEAYAAFLTPYYENALSVDNTSKSVLAYRKGGATNIHHAKSLFEEIRKRKNCSVIALDISGFFDCLDHRHLRGELTNLLGVDSLEGHHWTVFKNISRYAWVETSEIKLLLGNRPPRGGKICTHTEFNDVVRGRKGGLIQTHDMPFGIPQGTPVSGLYANIYLRSFDREMVSTLSGLGGSYRRYSDDIASVIPEGTDLSEIAFTVEKMLADYSLAISEKKTETATFKGGLLTSEKPIQYLGFTYDGKKILLRPSTLDAYRNKMRRGIHAKLVAAKMQKIRPSSVFKREALSRYTHVGQRRNFIKYAHRASDILEAREIRTQVKRHMTWFKRAWRREVGRVYGTGIINFDHKKPPLRGAPQKPKSS